MESAVKKTVRTLSIRTDPVLFLAVVLHSKFPKACDKISAAVR
jgi:hypothetical protein